MLTLLRKFRRSVFESSNMQKYIFYAVGEILLVMVGILLALQVNNWNEQKKSLRTEKAVLTKLINDLEGDFIRLTRLDSLYTSELVDLRSDNNIIQKESLTKEEVKKVMFYSGAVIRDINPRRTAYDEMLSSGKLYNLTNEDLVEGIIEYYQYVEGVIYQNRQSRIEFRNLFYGPDLADFWHFRGNPYTERQLKYAIQFFSDQETKGYRLLKQSSGWSMAVIQSALYYVDELQKLNRNLIEIIADELQI